jgi:large subunit ribosomal protein L30
MARKKETQDAVKMIKVTQVASPARRKAIQEEWLVALGLGKMHRTRLLQDTPTVRGLLTKAAHMIKVEAV